MFKKAKTELQPPKPPTFAHIIEDMETFLVEKPPTEKVRTLPSSSTIEGNATNSCNDVENWWKVFETFCSDNEDLQVVRRRIIASQKLLNETQKEINEKTDSIQREIDVALQDPPIDIGWCLEEWCQCMGRCCY